MKHFLIYLMLLLAITVHAEVHHQINNNSDSLQAIINPPDNAEDSNTWMGADGAVSIELNPGQYVWIFCDTLLGKVSNRARYLNTMRHNTVGTVACKPDCGIIQKYTQSTDPIFTPDQANQYYWPTAGSKLTTKLFLTGYALDDEPNDTGFNIAGTNFMVVENPLDVPSHWKYRANTIPNTDANLNWATAAVTQDNWLYIFGSLNFNDNHKEAIAVLSRISLNDAESEHWSAMEYWLGSNHWQKNTPSPNRLAKIPGLPSVSEMSVGYNTTLGWYTVLLPIFGNFDIHLYTAAALTGPWLDQGVIYTVPAPWNPEKSIDPSKLFIVYAAKVHPELAKTNKEIVFTYNINQMGFDDFINNIAESQYWGLYVPQLVSVTV